MFQRIVSFFLSLWLGLVGWLGINRPPACNVVYARQSKRQKLDIYLPWEKGEVDVIFCIHGGGWSGGDKSMLKSMGKAYASQGYAAAALNYRFIDTGLPPERQPVNYVDLLDDIDSAIAALKAKLIKKGYTPRRMAITGGSAGAHLALLYGYSRGAQSAIPIAFLSAAAGPTDFSDPAYSDMPNQLVTELAPLLAGRADYDPRPMSPLYYVDSGAPPTLTTYGARDELVPPSQGTLLKTALDAAGVRNDLFIFPNSGHGDLHEDDAGLNELYNAKMREYFDTYFG